MTLHVEVSSGEGVRVPTAEERVAAAVRMALESEGVQEAEISVALIDDEAISQLNQEYLGHAGPTDVISFALHEDGEAPLGDLYVGVEQAERQSTEWGSTPAEEVLRLALHGTLHVLGYDHPEEDRAESPMYRRQEELLARFLGAERGHG